MSFASGFGTSTQKPEFRVASIPTKKTAPVSNAAILKLGGALAGIILLGFALITFGPALKKWWNAPTPELTKKHVPKFTEAHIRLIKNARVIGLLRRYNGAGQRTLEKRGEKFEFVEIRPLSTEQVAILKDRCRKLIVKLPPASVISAARRDSLKAMHTEVRSSLGPSPKESSFTAALSCYAIN